MNAEPDGPNLGEFGFAGDDYIVPFQVDALDTRGRIVQAGPLLDEILGRHDYPEPIARLLAEMLVLASLLGASLKFEGKLILQTKSDGPVDMLIADYATPGALRGYARFDDEKFAKAVKAGETTPQQLLGTGVMALTIDQGVHTQRYQGVVALDGSDLEDIARTYFRQSEQIPTDVRLAVGKQVVPGANGGEERWRAGGLIAQFLPDSSERLRLPDLQSGDSDDETEPSHDPTDDAWLEVCALLATVEPTELLDPTVGSERLLYRLFHEHGVRVYEGSGVADRCSCSREKIRAILEGFSKEEVRDSIEKGKIEVRCEFCSTAYDFDPDEL